MLKNIAHLSAVVALALLCVTRVSADEPPGTKYPQSSINLIIETSAAPPGSWWCGPAAMQAAIRWNTGTRYEQRDIWNFMRDHTCGDLGGRDAALPGTVGDGESDIRKMNISKDFGVDPHAEAWGMKHYTGNTYHYRIYNSLYDATRWLLWAVEHYNQPVITIVGAGNHNVDVVGHKSQRSALDVNGPGAIYRMYYYDSLNPTTDPLSKDYQWGQWNWDDYFKAYSGNNGWDPEPTTGWYITPPEHWWTHWVTVQRDDESSYTPDWATTMVNGQVGFIFHRTLTYLPKVRSNSGGWNSRIVIRNNAASAANVSITFYYGSGSPAGALAATAISAGAVLEVDVSSVVGAYSGSAVVAAGGDVSVVVKDQNTDGRSYAYNGVSASAGDPALRTGRTIYTPLALARYGSWHTKISVLNTGAASANISITYYNQNGSVNRTVQKSALAPNASEIYDANTDFGSQFTGSAQVSSNQNIAVVVNETNGSMNGVYNGVSGGARTVRVPLVLRGWNGWQTSLQVQNLEASSTTATIRYYDSNGANPQTVAHAIESRGFWNAPLTLTQWSGVAVVSSSNTNVAVEVDEYNPVGYLQSYTGLGWATATAYLPQVTNSNNWVTGVQIQNAGSAVSQVRVTVNGVYKWQGDINPNGWYNWSATAEGSAVVQSLNGKPLVVMVDIYNTAGNDRLMSYTGDNR